MEQRLDTIDSAEGWSALLEQATAHLARQDYRPGTLENYRYAWKALVEFAAQGKVGRPLSALGEEFLKSHGIPLHDPCAPLSFRQEHLKRSVRVLIEFALHRCIGRRAPRNQGIALSPAFGLLLADYEEYARKQLNSKPRSLKTRRQDITQFLHFLGSKGVAFAALITPQMISEFMGFCVHFKVATRARRAASLRSFLRFLCMNGVLIQDTSDWVPVIYGQKGGRLPSVWKSEEVTALLSAVDRSSPQGKRDYAILLLACRLGMRASDIRSLRLEHLRWEQARIERTQTKGGALLNLPLGDEVGSALIEYLRYGRPQSSPHREVFLRVNAPFAPFWLDNNLHSIVTTYRRRAGLPLASHLRERRGLHSLRHTLASRLLEKGTSLETISSILGHESLESTRIYTSIDIEALRSVAVDPEEFFHA